jgi:predicted nucleotidyltransferase
MTRDEVIARIRSRAPDIRALGARALFLFGSAARDELREDSDIDVFIGPTRKLGLHSSSSRTFFSSWKRNSAERSISRRGEACIPD